jgi:hypothetical protein
MRPQFTSTEAHSIASPSSPFSASDRRLSALARHLVDASPAMDSQNPNDTVSASPTSGVQADSVFAHVVRAPEDPILGVLSLPLSLTGCREN